LSNQVSRTIELPGTPTAIAFGGGSIWLSLYGVQTGRETPHSSP
jgi:hypothetical protein